MITEPRSPRRIFRSLGLVALLVLVLGASVAIPALASATPVNHWIACAKQVGGTFANAECAKEGAPNEWESVRTKEGEKTSLTATGKSFSIAGTVGGIKTTFNCDTEVLSTSAENPTGGGSGTAKAEVKYSGCKVETPTSCSVTATTNASSSLELLPVEGIPQVQVKPSEGTKFATFAFSGSGCAVAGVNPTLTGTYKALFSNWTSQLEVSPATSAGLKLGGQNATATGTVGLKTGAGGNLRAEPAGAPTNTSLPVITGSSPQVGTSDSAERGAWTSHGEPITFTYQWLRCNGVGTECSSIAGATNLTYTPVEADVGHTLEFKVTAKNASGETTATSKPTNLVTIITAWRKCTKVAEGTGVYGDSGCLVAGGSKTFSKVPAAENDPFTFGNIAGEYVSPPHLEWTMSGVKLTVNCTSWSGGGKLRSLANGPNTSETELRLTGCVPGNPSLCTVKSAGSSAGEIRTYLLTGTPLETGINPPIKFAPSSGANIMTFTFEGEKCALNGTNFLVQGYLKGEVDNSKSAMTFGAGAATATVNGSGNPFTLWGKSKIQTAAGETLSLVAP